MNPSVWRVSFSIYCLYKLMCRLTSNSLHSCAKQPSQPGNLRGSKIARLHTDNPHQQSLALTVGHDQNNFINMLVMLCLCRWQQLSQASQASTCRGDYQNQQQQLCTHACAWQGERTSTAQHAVHQVLLLPTAYAAAARSHTAAGQHAQLHSFVSEGLPRSRAAHQQPSCTVPLHMLDMNMVSNTRQTA